MPNISDGRLEGVPIDNSDARSEASYDLVSDEESTNNQTSKTRAEFLNEDASLRSDDTPDLTGDYQDLQASAKLLTWFNEAFQEVMQLVENASTDKESDISEVMRQLRAKLKDHCIELGDDTDEKLETMTYNAGLWRVAFSKTKSDLRDECMAHRDTSKKLEDLTYCVRLWKKAHNNTLLDLGDERKSHQKCSEQLIYAERGIESARWEQSSADKHIEQLEDQHEQFSRSLEDASEDLHKATLEIDRLRFQVGRLQPQCEGLAKDLLEARKESHDAKFQAEQKVAQLEAQNERFKQAIIYVTQERDESRSEVERSKKNLGISTAKFQSQIQINTKDFEEHKSKLADEIQCLKAQNEYEARIHRETESSTVKKFDRLRSGMINDFRAKVESQDRDHREAIDASTEKLEALQSKMDNSQKSFEAQLECKDRMLHQTKNANRDYAALQDDRIQSLEVQLKFRDQIRKDLNDELHKAYEKICDSVSTIELLNNEIHKNKCHSDSTVKSLKNEIYRNQCRSDSVVNSLKDQISTLKADSHSTLKNLAKATKNYEELYTTIDIFFDQLFPIALEIDKELEGSESQEPDTESQPEDQDKETDSDREVSESPVVVTRLLRLRRQIAKAVEKAEFCEKTIKDTRRLSREIHAKFAGQVGKIEKYKTMLEENQNEAQSRAQSRAEYLFQLAAEAEKREGAYHKQSMEFYDKHKEYLKLYTDTCKALSETIAESSKQEKTQEMTASKENYAHKAKYWWAMATQEGRKAEREQYRSEHLKADAATILEKSSRGIFKKSDAKDTKAAEPSDQAERKQTLVEEDNILSRIYSKLDSKLEQLGI